ncbi:MAG: EthD family reductase [Candidatus Promineofilum sp.]|nr:EthD family reductase [Promineifilum sp.]
MYKFVVIYYRVDDEMTLEEFFSNTHLPLVEALPGLRRFEVSRILSQPFGQSRFHLMAEAYFDDDQAWLQAQTSETGIALMNALKPWAENKLIAWFYAESFAE